LDTRSYSLILVITAFSALPRDSILVLNYFKKVNNCF